MLNQQDARLGQKVGKYRLMGKLGGGGFGTVYLAENQRERLQVAVKVLHIPQMSDEELKSFINETRMMGLHHPHIMPLLDFGISQKGLPFLVMEYAPEGTLRDHHPKGERIPLPLIVSYVDQIASALQYAHDHQIIHRDVKPENILVGTSGTLLVSDFGVAKFLEQSVQISRQTQVGTPMYMAPEQYMGYPCFASDQYALAVAIYEWICGIRPFQGTALGLTVQHMNTPPPRLRDHLPELSEEVEHVILKALAKAPEDRFERIEEMASALRSAAQLPMAHGLTIEGDKRVPLILPEQVSQPAAKEKLEALASDRTEVAPVKPAIRTGDHPLPKHSRPGFLPALLRASGRKHRPSNRFPLLIGGALGLISLLIALILILKPMVFLQGRSITPQKTPTQQKQMAEKWIFFTDGQISTAPTMVGGTLYVDSLSANGNKVYAIDAKSGRQIWASPLADVAYLLPTVQPMVQGNVLYIGAASPDQTNPDSTNPPDPTNGKVHAIDTKTGHEIWTFPRDGSISISQLSVQNGILSIETSSPGGASNKVYAVDTKTGRQIWFFPQDGSSVSSQLTVQNGILYVRTSSQGDTKGQVYAIDARTGSTISTFPTNNSFVYGFSVQNGILYIETSSPSDARGQVSAIDTKTGSTIWTSPTNSSFVYGLSVQNGILYIDAFGSNDARGTVYAIDTKTGGKIWSFPTDDNNAYELSVQNGVLHAISGGETQKVYAIDAKSGQQKWVFSLPEPVHGSMAVQSGILYVGAIPSDGMGKSKIYAIDVQTGHETWSSPTGGNLFSLSTTTNGELYAASSDGIVYAWTLPAPPSRASE